MKKTKIVCTIGPACRSEETIEQLVKSGMNVARINFSHATLEEKQGVVDAVKEVLTLSNDMIDKVARDINDERTAYLSGVGKHEDRLISILNIGEIFMEKEAENV